MGLFGKKTPPPVDPSALFGATAMVFALCIDTISQGGTTSYEERTAQMSALRKTLNDLKPTCPGGGEAIMMLDRHFPVDPLYGVAGTGTAMPLSPTQAQAIGRTRQGLADLLASGRQGPALAEAIAPLVSQLRKSLGGAEILEEHATLVLALTLDKVLFDTQAVSADERASRRSYCAQIGANWIVRLLSQATSN
jgi:hypothetical protein